MWMASRRKGNEAEPLKGSPGIVAPDLQCSGCLPILRAVVKSPSDFLSGLLRVPDSQVSVPEVCVHRPL